MRVIIQRVSRASVTIDDKLFGNIGKGLLVLVGFEEDDNNEDVLWMSGKISRLRIFNDAHGVMNCSVCDVSGKVLVVSQFTLHASTKKGNRPSYIKAAKPETAIPLYDFFIDRLKADTQLDVQTGKFGAMMQVELVNDGPVTIFIDSRDKE
ncbi:MAG: D-aminoacyl-tRNA deacylase [Bacteroidales bacterium]|nr:D-aminoacyl-tRNA deacylase [Bacteroidales bacterium]